ncbi:MAG: metallophosphoesterase [Chitinophagales bacterium]
MSRLLFPIFVLTLLVAAEYYFFQALKLVFPPRIGARFSTAQWVFLAINVALYLCFPIYRLGGFRSEYKAVFSYTAALFVMLLLAKIIVLLFLGIGDIYRIISGWWQPAPTTGTETGITRSAFLGRVAMGVAAVPFFSLLYGVVVNAYNYQVKRITLRFPNLPQAFDGFRFVQLSDIHSGSFTRTKPLEDAVRTINELNADAILFTGDLVNNITDEVRPYQQIFGKLKAKHGVFSTTGNHDYGDYVQWESPEAKRKNFQDLVNAHKEMGWDILMNEHRVLERNGDKIALLGIENWGHALHFPRYGKLDQAHKGTEEIPFKILLSHDPSHWDAQVRPEYPDIDLTLSGHTHGFQFGVENRFVKWSPSQWVYKQWAGLYQEGKQYIYVNRGFGFLFYPGRVGILPEITEITLKRA